MRKGRQSKGSKSLEEFAASLGRTDLLPAGGARPRVSGGKRKMDAREALRLADDRSDLEQTAEIRRLLENGHSCDEALSIIMQGSEQRVKQAVGMQFEANRPSTMVLPAAACSDPDFMRGVAKMKKIRKAEDLAVQDLIDLESVGVGVPPPQPPVQAQEKKRQLQRDLRKLPLASKFMTTQEYAKELKSHGLITTDPSAPHEGQHVFHIISAANGGPNHPDNYLYALGGQFNIVIGDKLDHLNCALAGLAAARKAVNISLEVAKHPEWHRHIRTSGGRPPTLFTTGRHANKSAEQLVKEGMDIIRKIRHDARG